MNVAQRTSHVLLVRYGAVPQVARFEWSCAAETEPGSGKWRNHLVVVETDRGEELGTVLDVVSTSLAEDKQVSGTVVRESTTDDVCCFQENQRQANQEFAGWLQRVDDWNLQLQLIDLEWTLDRSRLILYVLNDRGAETTRMALLAAAAGLGIVHVQPVGGEGVKQEPAGGGGCGSGGCGSGGCGS